MAVKEIVQVGNPILRKRASEVKEFNSELHTLLDDMKDTLFFANGAGLAAPQVGILKRVFFLKFFLFLLKRAINF